MLAGPALLAGTPLAGFGKTLPFILTTFVGSLIAFENIVTLLFIEPGLLVSYLTLSWLVAPGAIGSFGQLGTVQPHEPFAFEIINASEPVFFISKMQVPSAPFFIVP